MCVFVCLFIYDCYLFIYLRKLCEDVFCNAVLEGPTCVVHLLKLDSNHDKNEADKSVEATLPVCGNRLTDAAGGDESAPDVDADVREDGRGTIEEKTPKQMSWIIIGNVPVLAIVRSTVKFVKAKNKINKIRKEV